MSTTSSSRNTNVIRYVNTNRKKSDVIRVLAKSSSMKSMNNKPIYQGMILKMHNKNKSRNENKSSLKGKRSIYSVESINNINDMNYNYIQANSTRNNAVSFHIPNFAKILLNQKQNDFSYINKNNNNDHTNYRNNPIFSSRNSTNVNKKQSKSFFEINEEINQPLSYMNKTSRLKIENKNITNKKCISLKRKKLNEKSNNSSLMLTNSRNVTNVTSSKSPNKNLTYNSSEDNFIRKRASSSVSRSETSKQFDTEGPEEFHFMLVDILSKQKQSMIKLSNKLHIKNEGVDVNYLE